MNAKRCSPGSPKRDGSKEIPSIDEAIFNFPDEIIIEILVRLPVKSLLKFRCVCKSWLSIISSSQFVKTHLTVSTNTSDLSNYRALITIWHPKFEMKQCSLYSLIFEPLPFASVMDYPQKDPHSSVLVVGSCNGLFCIVIDNTDIYLWNPSTRVSKKLSSLAVNLRQEFSNTWGFGYDETNDDYKIVGIFQDQGGGVEHESIIVKIYSLKANSWKKINDFNGGIPIRGTGKFANGKLHYSATPGFDMNDCWNIVSIDLKSEEYGIVEQPNYGDDGSFDFFLGILGGCICILCDYQETRADVWVMKEYGIKESWTKEVTIPYINEPEECPYPYPLCMLPNGDIVLHFGTHFTIYNSKEKCFKSRGISNRSLFMEADVYVESLVSP